MLPHSEHYVREEHTDEDKNVGDVNHEFVFFIEYQGRDLNPQEDYSSSDFLTTLSFLSLYSCSLDYLIIPVGCHAHSL